MDPLNGECKPGDHVATEIFCQTFDFGAQPLVMQVSRLENVIDRGGVNPFVPLNHFFDRNVIRMLRHKTSFEEAFFTECWAMPQMPACRRQGRFSAAC
jgi:hypothetical protein